MSSGDEEPSVLAWRLLLERLGTPFDLFVAGALPLTAQTLEHEDGHGRYQAIVLATDSLVRLRDGLYQSALGAEEWEALCSYESRYGVRRVSAYATPGPRLGLTSPTWGGDVGDTMATVTPAGRTYFPELVGSVPLMTGTYGFVAAVTGERPFTTLVAGTSETPIVGVVTHPDGREELLVTVSSGPTSRHLHLLGPGLLSWATRGRYFGFRNFYLSIQVDDVLLGAAVPPPGHDPLRMSGVDLVDTARWSEMTDIRLDLAYNAWGAVARTHSGVDDPLAAAMTEAPEAFAWLNHTFGHLDLDLATSAQIHDEIMRNLAWAEDNDIPVDVAALVTGGHSGLENVALHEMADECGIRWLASDASREADIRPLGRAHAVPRYPINIPIDVATHESWAQRAMVGVAGATPGGLLRREADFVLDHLLGNDPRPHYTHQNALTGDRFLLDILDMVLHDYKALIVDPPVQLTLAEAGTELLRRATWSAVTRSGGVTAFLQDDVVTIENHTGADVDVPYVDEAGPTLRGWTTVVRKSVQQD